MDSQKIQIDSKLGTKRTHDKSGETKILVNHQPSTYKHLAQDRLKRLQSHLHHINKKHEKERVQPKRSTRSNSNCVPSTSNCAKSQSTIMVSSRQHHLNKESKSAPTKTTCSTSVATTPSSNSKCSGASSFRSNLKNTCAKSTALFDASNRLEKIRTTSANQRLIQLRKSLQEHQQTQERQKETNNNIYKKNSSKNVISETATQPNKTAKERPLAICDTSNDDIEPMEVDSEEHVEGTSVNKADYHKHEFNWDEDIEMTVVRFIPDLDQVPERRVDHMYFVLDTNVLLDNLVFVEDLTRLALGKTKGSMLFIPYIVIKELDRLKMKQTMQRTMAIRAIRYLNNKFDNSHQIQAQSAIEESEHLIDVDCADDSIVNCCLQLKKQLPHMMMLTNDNNLRLKAIATSIKVSCRSDLMRDYQEQFDALAS